ncbi:substrate-binding periplasmic protein [Saccharophagus degradans]|uniref:Transporter substrate-binding domain-containing protein n=1 Tax=Saccharophagus degradans TaxID=86304 RepID=A0AAW7X6F5_9GAMM|nr:transporter substrate-binding domain-containing protein [Saccharophagus degradans]MDO6423149.1 transporter substrate-binding domain-containing protein [Saccharophagus degradans]MDO6607327.1 transporter substrate-binding domain-containing protein [Saccharophagus degradans]
MYKLIVLTTLLALTNSAMACFEQPNGQPAKLVIPLQEPTKLVHNQFFLTLLPQILAVTEEEFGPCELAFYKQPLSSARVAAYLNQNKVIGLNWASASSERDKQLRAIKIPLLKGLMGHRILLLKKDNKDLLKNVKTVEDLKPFVFGLGESWPDTYILKYNGLKITTAAHYDLLFKMLDAGRYDLLSRGYSEALPELELHSDKDITYDEHIVLIYPLPVYFYVSPKNPELAKRIEKGLITLVNNGQFDKLFYNSPDIAQSLAVLNFEKRTKIYLCNTYIPEGAQLDNPALWHFPNKVDTCNVNTIKR